MGKCHLGKRRGNAIPEKSEKVRNEKMSFGKKVRKSFGEETRICCSRGKGASIGKK